MFFFWKHSTIFVMTDLGTDKKLYIIISHNSQAKNTQKFVNAKQQHCHKGSHPICSKELLLICPKTRPLSISN
jgi:hypothetical protein